MECKSTPKRISSIIKNHKTTRLGTVRKPDGRLTESPEETLQIMVVLTSHHLMPHRRTIPQDKMGQITLLIVVKTAQKDEENPLSAAGPDGIRPVMLQKAWKTINAAYTSIAKASYITSHTPDCWINATGIFLPKPGKGDYYNP